MAATVFVIPANAGIQAPHAGTESLSVGWSLDPRVRGDDDVELRNDPLSRRRPQANGKRLR